jgi:hypothetical protein
LITKCQPQVSIFDLLATNTLLVCTVGTTDAIELISPDYLEGNITTTDVIELIAPDGPHAPTEKPIK